MIELKYFERSDFQQLIHWVESPEFLLQWSGPAFEYPLTESQLEKYIMNANHDNSDTLIFKVVDDETGNVVGHISLGRIDRKHRSARVGKVLVGDENARGKGIGRQMINEILKIAFDELHMHRVSLGVFDFNTPAIACYEKAGFVKEGLLRDSSKIGDDYWNQWEMSILESEWQKANKR
ncbi:GNAT family N-acetyltransferase [Neobacillus mesonae]|uniref:GNAT family N-acetyltransferase n=1 Tax=Neobacillus mesonae TaxID=1193713 RepID=UPI00203E87ED|nr:GNAT family protein [Neobacillus mesonae]MCM3567255.1 GNAT family N-acetyltransferase [Neobacillus mesonae]